MKIAIKDSLRRLPGAMAGLLMLAGAACTTDPTGLDLDTPDGQGRSQMTIEFGISASEAGIRSRAVTEGDALSETFASDAVNSIWVGVFDVQTGNLVGQTHTTEPNGDLSATVDILYYDEHPTVRLFGVANFDGVLGRKGTEDFEPLIDLLNGVDTMADFFQISVDAESANAAQLASGAPLMMGVYKAQGQTDEPYAVTAVGTADAPAFTPGGTTDAKTDVTLNAGGVGNMYDRIDYAKFDGSIRLRRLLSQVHVTVEGGEGVTVSQLSYRKVNMPTEVYLQERATFTNGNAAITTFSTFMLKSPNKADALLEPQSVGTGVSKVKAAPGYVSDDTFTEADGLSFVFHQYENKHWGFNISNSLTKYADRERVRKDAGLMQDAAGNTLPIFLALSPYGAESAEAEANDYNNFASYFEIQLRVEVAGTDSRQPQSGVVTYRIHEGYCNDADGKASAKNLFDFTCVRNTTYNYRVTVNGLDSFRVDADAHGDNPGVLGGEVWTEKNAYEMESGQKVQAEFSPVEKYRGAQYFYYYAGGDGTPIWYSDWDEEQLASFPGLPDLTGATRLEQPSAKYGFTIGGLPVDRINELLTGTGTVSAEVVPSSIGVTAGNPKQWMEQLYLSYPGLTETDEDGCRTIYAYDRFVSMPEDLRAEMSVAFALAFQNDWDETPSTENGAVVGHIASIVLQQDGSVPTDADPVYTVLLDEEEVYSGGSFGTATELWTNAARAAAFDAHSVHTVKVTLRDRNENYKEIEYADQFVVYPTTLSWSTTSLASGVSAGDSYYGTYTHSNEGKDANFYGLYFLNDIDANTSTSALRTGAGKKVFTFDALYDGLLTIVSTGTSSSPNFERCLEVTDSSGDSQSSSASVAKTYTDTPFTFYVKKGEVEVAVTGSIDIMSVKFEYLDETPRTWTWDFTSSEWAGVQNALTTSGLNNFSVSVNGLSIVSTTGNVRGYENQSIYFNNSGTQCHFELLAHKSGTLKVNLQPNGSGRTLQVEVGGEKLDAISLEAKQYTVEVPITVDEPTKVAFYVGTGGGTYFYNVSYVEE